MDEMYEKSCGLSFDSPLLWRKNALLSDESRVFVFRSSLPVFSSRVQVCRSGHALVHRALSEFEILAFTLHLHH